MGKKKKSFRNHYGERGQKRGVHEAAILRLEKNRTKGGRWRAKCRGEQNAALGREKKTGGGGDKRLTPRGGEKPWGLRLEKLLMS